MTVVGTPDHDGYLFTYEQVAERLGVSVVWLRRQVSARRVPYVQLGRSVRFTEAQVQMLIADRTVQPIRPRGGPRSR